MRAIPLLMFAVAAGAALLPSAATPADEAASPIFGVRIPPGYRQWQLVSVAQEASFDELRAVLANPAAVKAYEDAKLPFPDGAVLVKLAWKRAPLAGLRGAFVPGAATTVQVMVKDAAKYASTGGWGFGRFVGGRPADEAQHRTCFACHEANVKDHDFVFTRLTP